MRQWLLLFACAACSPAPIAPAPDAAPVVDANVLDAGPDVDAAPVITVTVMATGGQTQGVALDATNVYWVDNGDIFTCPKSGCSGVPTVVAPVTAYGLTVAGANAYWTNPGADADGGDVGVCPKTGCAGPSSILGNYAGRADQIVVDANNVYWSVDVISGGQTQVGLSTVFECPLTGCTTPTVLADHQSPALWGNGGLALDQQNIYWTNDADWQIVSCAIGGCNGAPTVIFNAPYAPRTLAVDGGTIYWGDVFGGGIYKCSIADCIDTLFFIGTANAPAVSVVVYGSNVYWLAVQDHPTAQQPSALVMCPTSGCNGAPMTLTTMVSQPIGLAVDSTGAYVTGGGLLRVTVK